MATTASPHARPAAPPGDVPYPETDGKPMAETDTHARYLMDVRTALEDFFGPDPDVYVSGNLLLYYEEGNPRRSVSPDVFVVRGIPKRERRIYQVWAERVPPGFALEWTAHGTRRADQGRKRRMYERLGVQEYFKFDPLGEYLAPALPGHDFVAGRYLPLPPLASGGYLSQVMGF